MVAGLTDNIDVVQPTDIAEVIAFAASVPRHVNLSEITVLPTAQAVRAICRPHAEAWPSSTGALLSTPISRS